MPRFLVLGLLSLAFLAAGQEVPPRTAFAVADLKLLSHERLSDGTVAHSGPLCAAIVMAWFAHHGYPGLLPDLNGDGKVNEEDTLILAGRFAREMGVRPDQPALDPKLMDVVARYVGETYPKEFARKIWDDSFAAEYQAVFGKAFSPSDYPRIEVRLFPNASHGDYVAELGAGEGVIVGLGKEKGTNTFMVGRSFELAETRAGWPVDFVDTSDDPFQPGVQGQVFTTEMQKGPDHWLVRYAGWTPLEFMLSLSPIRRPTAGTVPGPCPTGAIGYDVVTVSSEWGTFKVEECVTREGDVDLYSYRVTNVSFLYKVKFQTTGPKPGEEVGCPDLKVVKLYACWQYTPRQEMEVNVTAVIQNVGTAPSGSFWICTSAGSASTMDHSGSLAPGATVTINASFNLGSPAGWPGFPIPVTVFADCMYQVKECAEDNNEASFSVGRINDCK